MNKSNQKKIYIVNTTCYVCEKPMNAVVIHGNPQIKNGQVYGPESFTLTEVKLAEEHKVYIKEQYSSVRGESYSANTCPHCGAFVGQHYLFTDIYCAAQFGDCGYISIDLD